jgi:hypothetical protein
MHACLGQAPPPPPRPLAPTRLTRPMEHDGSVRPTNYAPLTRDVRASRRRHWAYKCTNFLIPQSRIGSNSGCATATIVETADFGLMHHERTASIDTSAFERLPRSSPAASMANAPFHDRRSHSASWGSQSANVTIAGSRAPPSRAPCSSTQPRDDFAWERALVDRLRSCFERGAGQGLLQLGAGEAGSLAPPALAWWRDFASGRAGDQRPDSASTAFLASKRSAPVSSR